MKGKTVRLKVYIVGDNGPEHNSIRSVHATYEGTLAAWDRLRLQLLGDAKSYLKKNESCSCREMWERMAENLSCKDPREIDNYPHETPYIHEYEVEK